MGLCPAPAWAHAALAHERVNAVRLALRPRKDSSPPVGDTLPCCCRRYPVGRDCVAQGSAPLRLHAIHAGPWCRLHSAYRGHHQRGLGVHAAPPSGWGSVPRAREKGDVERPTSSLQHCARPPTARSSLLVQLRALVQLMRGGR